MPGGAVLGQVVLARRCATPGAGFVRTVCSVARGDSTGAVLGRGLGHYDRCRGPDSEYRLEVPQLQLIFKDVDFTVVAQAFPMVQTVQLVIEILPVTGFSTVLTGEKQVPTGHEFIHARENSVSSSPHFRASAGKPAAVFSHKK